MIKNLLKRKEIKVLIIIFLFALCFRLFFVVQSPFFSSDQAYFELRNVEYIHDNIGLMVYDNLSYGGRFILTPFLFYYLMALFTMILPAVWVLKFFPELLAAFLVFVVYSLTKRITHNNTAALLSAFIAGFSPIFITQTLNQASVYCLIVLVFFFLLYTFFEIKNYLTYFIIASFILPLINPMGFLLPISLIFYYLLLSLDNFKLEKIKNEAILFCVLLILLINIIMFKNIFLEYGFQAVWQNVPLELLVDYFGEATPLGIVTALGVIPLLFGLGGFVVGFWLKKTKTVYFMSALVLSDLVLMALKLINLNEALLFLGLILAIMSALTLDVITNYLRLTKFYAHKKVVLYSVFVILLIGITWPAYIQASHLMDNTINQDYYDAMLWIKDNTPEDVVVLADISEGHYVTSIAERQNVGDTYFLFAPDRYSEMRDALITESLVKMRKFLHKYNVEYVFVSQNIREMYNINDLKYINDKRCFDEVFSNEEATVYLFEC
ncbi:MAG: hypothetical protein ABIF40_02395 [archaeon]